MSITININAARLAQVALGGAAVYGGWKLSSGMVERAYHEDFFGDPSRIVHVDGQSIIRQDREPQGGTLTKVMMGAGGAAAFAGSVLALGGQGVAAEGMKGMLRMGGGVALFALGTGAIAGALAMSKQYEGADFEPIR